MAYKEKSEAIKYNNEFNRKTYDRINLTIPKGQKEIIQTAANERGESVNAYIYAAIVQRMEREQTTANAEPERWPPSTNDVVRRLSTLPIAEQKRIQSLPSSEQYRALGFIPPMG